MRSILSITMNNKNYPKWIDDYARAIHQAFLNMTPLYVGSIDVFYIARLLEGTFLDKVYQAIKIIKNKNYSLAEIAKSFATLATLRIQIYWLMLEFLGAKNIIDRKTLRESIDFFVEILYFAAKKDAFGYNSGIRHSQAEIESLLQNLNLKKANPVIAREIGKFYNSLVSLVFALYDDFLPQDSHEVYGPYDVSKIYGKGYFLLIKDFPKIKPVELWPKASELKHQKVTIYQIYSGIKFRCELIGMHSVYEGDPVNNLKFYYAVVDGKAVNEKEKIKELTNYFSDESIKQAQVLAGLSQEQLKLKGLEWLMYQLKDFFKLANMDWRPTKEMWQKIKDKNIPKKFDLPRFPAYDEFVNSPEYEVYWLKDLYK